MNGSNGVIVADIGGRAKMKIGMKIRIIGSAASEPNNVRSTAWCPWPCWSS